MEDTLVQPQTTTAFPDLSRVLSRMAKDTDRFQFLQNLYRKLLQKKKDDPTILPILKQAATLLAPLLEQQSKWAEAGRILEESEYYPQAMADYLKINAFAEAAWCAEKGGDYNAALQLYLKGNRWLHAAEVARRVGDEQQAHELVIKAIDYFVAQKDYHQASLAAEQAGMVKEALKLQADQIDQVGYTDAKYMYQELVERAVQNEMVELALELSERGGLYDTAIEIAMKHRLFDRVPAYYRKYLDAVYPKERVPIFRQYIEFLTEHGTQNAVRAAYQQEIDYLEQHQEYLSAAELAHLAGSPKDQALYRLAIDRAEGEADFAKAALAATKLGLTDEAEYYGNPDRISMIHPPLIVANWKMNTTLADASVLATLVRNQLHDMSGIEVVLCPPYIWLQEVASVLEVSSPHIHLGAQNCFPESAGPYTGEVSITMLKDLCHYVIVGHSERREHFGESSDVVSDKVQAALHHSITPIVCVGEQRKEEGSIKKVIHQLDESLDGVQKSDYGRLVVAYEPVWSISTVTTGETASGEYANQVCGEMKEVVGEDARVIYGGSVNADNIAEFMNQSAIDGVLVGGASLKAREFMQIAKAASHGQ